MLGPDNDGEEDSESEFDELIQMVKTTKEAIENLNDDNYEDDYFEEDNGE